MRPKLQKSKTWSSDDETRHILHLAKGRVYFTTAVSGLVQSCSEPTFHKWVQSTDAVQSGSIPQEEEEVNDVQ